MNQSLRSASSQCGAAALEFALVLPIFVLLIYGLVTFGSVFYTQITLSRAAADGARALGMVNGISSFESIPDPVKDGIRLEVVNSLAQSIITPLGLGSLAERQNWLQDNVMPQVSVDQGSCGGGDAATGVLRVRVVYPFAQVRMLPPIQLPLIGSMDAWMPQTLSGCAIAQL
jgi:hypothetical protein